VRGGLSEGWLPVGESVVLNVEWERYVRGMTCNNHCWGGRMRKPSTDLLALKEMDMIKRQR
jgi:hypothetical protein